MDVNNPNPAAMELSERLSGDWYIEGDGRAAHAYQVDPRQQPMNTADAGGSLEVVPEGDAWWVYAYDWNDRRGAFDLADSKPAASVREAALAAARLAKGLTSPGSRMSRRQYRQMSGGQRADDFDFQGWL